MVGNKNSQRRLHMQWFEVTEWVFTGIAGLLVGWLWLFFW